MSTSLLLFYRSNLVDQPTTLNQDLDRTSIHDISNLIIIRSPHFLLLFLFFFCKLNKDYPNCPVICGSSIVLCGRVSECSRPNYHAYLDKLSGTCLRMWHLTSVPSFLKILYMCSQQLITTLESVVSFTWTGI